ncbi:hypothetical protein LWI28_021942 [Acer negundo]|uniref:Uncharacterized protein n=1 Tax=Acer negundo TaxID=4023 RepID=A0AAD5IAH4_ACENE|nr:hypothetical protein LWI28_021942 [Acer negundo]
MDVEENLELTWDDAQMDEEENLGLSWSKNWEDIPETQDQSFEDFLVIGKDKGSKPSAKKWRVTEIQNYDKLLELFAKDIANGEVDISAKEKVKQWEMEGCDQFVDLEEVTTDNFNPVSPQCNSQGANSSKVLKRKASMVNAFEKQVKMIQVGMNNVADAIREGNVIAEKGIAVIEKTRPRIYEEQDIYV